MEKVARIIEENKDDLVDIWVETVREELIAPRITADLALRDHVPLLLDDIINIMKRYADSGFDHERPSYRKMLKHSIGHGRHRATSSGYDIEQVLREYILLHRILTNKLTEEEVFTTEVGNMLKYIIENSMLYSTMAFGESLREMRHKLIGTLAHDMRNPISAAYLSVDMMNHDDGKERFEKIRKMSKNSLKRSLDLLEGLLESVSVKAGEGMTMAFYELDLMDYIRSVYHEAKAIYSNEIKMQCNVDRVTGVFDGDLVRRVVENLFNNAIKHGSRETPVTIFVEDSEEYVTIRVHNYGNPIPEEKQKEIFEFMNTSGSDKSKDQGEANLRSWGMGLTLVITVAEAHGGELKLESNREQGTTFSVSLGKNKNKPGKVRTTLNLSDRKDRFNMETNP